MKLPTPRTIGLSAMCDVVYHRVTLRTSQKSRQPQVQVPAPPQAQPDRASGLPELETFNGAVFQRGKDGDKTTLSSRQGGGDRGGFLPGQRFSEGVIEVDLKGSAAPGSSFVGVVFNAEDGDTYEAIYLRPFNFGHADPVRRSHSVQYIAHPEWPWAKLRKERPDEFESRVNPEPKGNDWFHARVEVTKTKVRVYVNDSRRASLDVPRLHKTGSGKVGLWFNGVANFANVKVSR